MSQKARLRNQSSNAFVVLLFGFALALANSVSGSPSPEWADRVAIHDSELTRALESLAVTNATTPSGPGTTGFEWWPTNWQYFVMPESVEESLRSDGTAYEVLSDADISAGRLLGTNGEPRYPILISLAAEAIQDDEIAPLTNYVAAGGTLLVGASSFTRNTNGATRGDFAFANPMGLHMVGTNLQNWAANVTFSKTIDHSLVAHIPGGVLDWHLPSAADEVPWGVSPTHTIPASHLVWRVQASDATVIAQGDAYPYLTIKPYGKGAFIYCAALQPLIGHGGFAPSMYAYGIFRKAIETAFASAKLPVPRLSPWPFQYDAAMNVRHDLENSQPLISAIESSAEFESTNGVSGDYYFCTGTLREEMKKSATVVAGLRSAVGNYGATIGSHNGGLPNPNNPSLQVSDYDYWHWGPDEALDVVPSGYDSGKAYALASISNSFSDVEGWLTGLTNGIRSWAGCYFNSVREDSYDILEELGVKTAGEQKLGPFPHWTLSTRTAGKRYSFVSLPVTDWFVGTQVAQSLESGHTVTSVDAAIDFYYRMGGLINLYSHSLSDGGGQAGGLVQEYIRYCATKPRLWSTNVAGVYSWWLARSNAQITPSFSTNGNQAIATLSVTGATDPQTAVEWLIPHPAFSELQVLTNGVVASAGSYRTNGQLVKLLVGTSVTNAEIRYNPMPAAEDDVFYAVAGGTLTVPAEGVLSNDVPGLGGGLTALLVSGPVHGVLDLNTNGGFTYIPATNYVGVDTFTYRVNDGLVDGNVATVALLVTVPGQVWFADDFSRATDPASLLPWVAQSGTWSLTGGHLQCGTNSLQSYGYAWLGNTWTNYMVQARFQFPAGAYGAGLGGRLNPITGARYAAWIYPESSPGGSGTLKLLKFQNWSDFGYNGSGFAPMGQFSLPSAGTNWHTLRISFRGNLIKVYYDDALAMTVTDTEEQPYVSGGITLDMWTASTPYVMAADDVLVGPGGADQTVTFDELTHKDYGDPPFTVSATASSGLPVTFSILSGPATIAGNTVTLTGVGTVTVRASQSGDADYDPAPPVDQSFNVSPAVLTVAANDQTKTYGAPVPALTAGFSGFVNDDDAGVLSGSPSLTTAATANSPVGSYTITAAAGTLSAANYTFSFVTGQLTVNPATLAVTANDAWRLYGEVNPAFTASLSGFVNGEDTSVVSGSPELSTTAESDSPVGDYPINAALGTLGADNYSFTFIAGTLKVMPTNTLFYDSFARPTEPGSLSPWVVQSGQWTITSGVLQGSNNSAQTYEDIYITNQWANYAVEAQIRFPVSAFGGGLGGRLDPATGAHYAAWIYPEGSAGGSSVMKLVKFQNWTTFGYTNTGYIPMLQVSLPSVGTNWHTLKLEFLDNLITVSYDGTQMMSVTDLEAQPYSAGAVCLDMWNSSTSDLMQADQVLAMAVTKTDQTITFNPIADKTYGDAPFALSASASSGLPVSLSIVTGPASLAGDAVTLTGAGVVTVRASQAGDESYNPAPDVDQSFTVNPAPLTVTADSKNKVYGEADPLLTYQITGGSLVNGDSLSGSLSRVAGENAGTYAIQQDTLTAGSNYDLTFISANLTITPADSAITVVSSGNPLPTGANITFTATVTILAPGSGTPIGSVQFVVDGSPFGGPAALTGGIATLDTAALLHGYHTVAAEYAGDGNFQGSTNSLSPDQLVNTSPVSINTTMSAIKNQSANLSGTKLLLRCSDADGDTMSLTAVSSGSAQGGTVSLAGTTITYAPPANYTGADSFTYTTSDTYGATDTGTVAVTVAPIHVSLVIPNLIQLPDGNKEVRASGIPNESYLIQASQDLNAWSTISTNSADSNGVIVFQDLLATNYTSRYYRLAAP